MLLIERILVRIDDRLVPDEICLVGLDELGLLVQLPAEEQDRVDEHHHVVGEEGIHGEVTRKERGISVAGNHADEESKRNVRGPWLEAAEVREASAVKTLCVACAVEEDEVDADDDVVNDLGAGDDVGEPGEDLRGAGGSVEEGEEGEERHDAEAVDRDTGLGALAEETGRLAFNGKAVERTCAVVCVGVAGGEDGGNEQGVGEVGKTLNAETCQNRQSIFVKGATRARDLGFPSAR